MLASKMLASKMLASKMLASKMLSQQNIKPKAKKQTSASMLSKFHLTHSATCHTFVSSARNHARPGGSYSSAPAFKFLAAFAEILVTL